MSNTAVQTPYHGLHYAGEHQPELPFWRKYIFSTDHKVIGIQFLFMSLIFLFIGGILAMIMRWQLGWPSNPDMPLPGGSMLPESMVNSGIILPEFYNASVTMHGTIMVFFAIMPLLVGVWANYLIPLQIGAPDMAFPKLNMASFWTAVPAGVLILAGFFVEGGHSSAGWTQYAPLSSNPEWTGVYAGQQLLLLAIVVLGFSSLMGAVNYITTVINLRAPGMTWFRLPLATWALFITAILILLAIPVLTGACILLLFDQTIGTTFFEASAGGQPLLWQHLFWFFGHPEVYILILPAMGFVSEIIAAGSRKPIFGYHAMVLAIVAIAFLGWLVWGHHMFQSGMNPMLGMSFMVTTMVIAVPSAIKVFNWMATMWRGDLHFHTPMLHAVSFVAMFAIGGLSGVFLASTPVDIFLHDTYFVVAHLHYVLFGGSLFAIFAAITFWYPKMFGRLMSERWAKIHFWLTLLFFNLTFFPMHQLGIGGHIRRLYDPTQYPFLEQMQELNTFISISALLLFGTQLIFVVNFLGSLWRGEKAPPNPWRANSLEWQVPSPPPHGNFERMPIVFHGPYEYSSPLSEEDYLPQNEPPREEPAHVSALHEETR
ncbi:MAG TPA: cbb3-type cytochrome c oxidase subunit I [Longimicrobiales bacterium]|nr:cbb3-type cytochrome c oxidase subunit I [Longimicrobiales bacterium]